MTATRPPFRNWSRRLDTALIALAMLGVLWFFFWTVRFNGGFDPVLDDDYFTLLVRGWKKGHLYLDRAPPAELLALADPYDPAQNGPFRLPDATYFRGHYYLYFGATPALVLMLPYALLTGHELPTGAAVWVFCSVGFLTACGLWLAIRRRYFPESAVWSGAAGVLVLGLGTHVLALTARPMHWELPIAAGYAFGMLALAAVYAALHGRRPVLAMGAAGLCVGLAASARPPCLFGALLLVPPLWMAWRERNTSGAWWWRGALAASGALAACLVAMLAHNNARFGNVFEFGQNYQLTAARELDNRHFGFDYMPHNLGVYFLQAVRWTWEFPFVSAQTVHATIRGHAGSEEIAGLGVTLPFLWLALAAPLAWRDRDERERRALRMMIGAAAGLFFGVGAFMAAFFSTTERYVTDFAPALGLLAVCGWLAVERRFQAQRGRSIVASGAMLATATTAAIGCLICFDYHGRAMSRVNAAWWVGVEQRCHDALSRVGLWLGQFSGPRVVKVRFRPQPAGTREVFWTAADARAKERVVIEHLREREIRFGYERDGAVRWGRPLTWEPAHTHTVELQLPSLYGAPGGSMRAMRHAEEFRERSSAAVWFSGGRALGEIVEPLAPDIVGGGDIGRDFSGEVRSVSRRVFRADELPLVVNAAPEPTGGTLRLRAVLAQPLAPAGEPLFAAGVLYGSDLVFVRDAGDGAVTFHFDHFMKQQLASSPMRLAAGREHTIEIALPSCRAGGAFGRAAAGEVAIRVDGAEVLRGRSECFEFAPGDECVARNPFGTTCGRVFRGWLLEARWMGAAK